MKYGWILFGLILFLNSCTKDDDSIDNPLYINGSFDNISLNEDYIVGDSAEITFYYTIEDQEYSFYELTSTKLEVQNDSVVDNYLIELKLVNDEKTEVSIQNSIVWKFFPTVEGSYGISYINASGDTIQKHIRAKYDNTSELNMKTEDYKIIVDSVANNPELAQYLDAYETGELYFGADSYYENFDLRIDRRISSGQTEYESLSNEKASDLVWERLIEGIEILLKEKYPTNKYEKFIVQFDTYDNGIINKYNAEFISLEINSKIEFEFLSKELITN